MEKEGHYHLVDFFSVITVDFLAELLMKELEKSHLNHALKPKT